MDDLTLRWIIGGQVAVNIAFAKLWWDHAKDCRERRAEQSSLKTMVEDMRREIGTHDTGLRGSVHALRGEISPFVIWAQHKMEREK
jgi:hypothetical protein